MASLVSLAWLLRVQWGQNEAAAVSARAARDVADRSARARPIAQPLFRSRGFWLSLGAVFVLQSITALHDYFPRYFPDIPLAYDFTSICSQPPLSYLPAAIKKAAIYFTFVGVAYFIQARTAFSLWSIYLITQVIAIQSRWTFEKEIPALAWRDQHFASCVVYSAGHDLDRPAVLGARDPHRMRGGAGIAGKGLRKPISRHALGVPGWNGRDDRLALVAHGGRVDGATDRLRDPDGPRGDGPDRR
jgi:hypothetical protein